MSKCPRCTRPVPADGRFCPGCGAAVNEGAALRTQTSLPSSRPTTPSSYPPLDEARFLPGDVVAGRYRIVGLLGRGGMGEVYRADDLKLGQPVALKFLPEAVEREPERLRRFLNEVRLALRITHPNVCRVHDIGDVDGQHFITMEYVDGEDLASLLRRIGRLPHERAVEIARQLCSGLAAAHDQGILHRDLKPANVMIDGRGRARITDFGLAGLTGTVEGNEVRAGTPSYMAPEQLQGREVTERSDIYALGLVLYEMFSGKPAFNARSVPEMLQLQQSTTPSDMSNLRDMDPAVEQAVLRALSAEPSRRPPSALALAAALPGGDPLAAALAAGETPSPEMVAEAGDNEGLAPGLVALALLLIVVGMGLTGWLNPRTHALGLIETPLSVGALNERARLMIERLGYGDAPADMAHGVVSISSYATWLNDEPTTMRERIRAGRPAVLSVLHRESPEPLLPFDGTVNRPQPDDPPLTLPGMLNVWVDPQGRLIELAVVPPDRAPPADTSAGEPAVEQIWDSLFREAELDLARFKPVEPRWSPSHFADRRAAWEGTFEEAPEMPLRVEAAAFQGRAVSFRIVGPWSLPRDDSAREGRQRAVEVFILLIFLSVLVALVLLGRRNIRLGRSDLKSARRIGLYIFLVETVGAAVAMTWIGSPMDSFRHLIVRVALNLFLGVLVFTAYVALEPYARRLWPRMLISWTRLLSGRLRDAQVGRDVLVGAAFGVLTAFLTVGHTLLPPLLGLPEESLGTGISDGMVRYGPALSELCSTAGQSVGMPMFTLVVVVVLRLLLRRTGIALGTMLVVSSALEALGSTHPALDMVVNVAVLGLTLYVLMRVGVMAAASLWFFDAVSRQIFALDLSAWTAPSMIVFGLAALLVAGYAAYTALGGRVLLEDRVLAEAPR